MKVQVIRQRWIKGIDQKFSMEKYCEDVVGKLDRWRFFWAYCFYEVSHHGQVSRSEIMGCEQVRARDRFVDSGQEGLLEQAALKIHQRGGIRRSCSQSWTMRPKQHSRAGLVIWFHREVLML